MRERHKSGKREVAVLSEGGFGGIWVLPDVIQREGFSPVLITDAFDDAALDRLRQLYARVEVLEDVHEVDTVCRAAASGDDLAGLFSCFDGLVLAAGRAAQRLDLPHCPVHALERARNKAAMRTSLARCRLTRLRHAIVAADADAAAVGVTIGFPCVAKPLCGAASHLVQKCADPTELRRALDRLDVRLGMSLPSLYVEDLLDEDATSVQPRHDFLVEQFAVGPEYCAEVIVAAGHVSRVALFAKPLIDDRFFERAFVTPVEGDREAVWSYIESVITALGIDSCACHVEVIEAADGPEVVEINAGRPGGGLLPIAVLKRYGRNLLVEIVRCAVGAWCSSSVAPEVDGRLATFVLYPPRSGTIASIAGYEEAAARPEVVDARLSVAVGDRVDATDLETGLARFIVACDGSSIEDLYASFDRDVAFEIVGA